MTFRFLCLAALLLAGCAEESSLPTPNGKGTIRAINAIESAPSITFRIEERAIDSMAYKSSSPGARFDDFSYRFNFDTVLAGQVTTTRIASVTQKIDVNRDYTFVVTGTLNAPSVTVWDSDAPEFAESDTNFRFRFAHVADTLGDVDIFLAASGVDPVAGMEVATVSYGEASEPIALPSASLVLTVTESGNPGAVVFQSGSIAFNARVSYLTTIFDGDATNVSPYETQIVVGNSASSELFDVRFESTVRFFQTAIGLAVADIYDDENLTSLLVANHAFGDITGDLPIAAGTTDFTYTAAGNTGSILLEGNLTTPAAVHNNVIVYDDGTGFDAISYIPDRMSVSTLAKIRVFNGVSNFESLDFYVVDADASIETAIPRQGLQFPSLGNTLNIAAGSHDLYVTETGEKTVIAGPERLDIALGDVVEIVLLDTVDPATAEILIVPQP